MTEIRLERILPKNAERVCDAWLRPGLLSAWLCEAARVTPREGGSYELFWDPPNPASNSTLGCRLLAVEPGRRLEFDWRGPDQLLELMPTGRTRVEVRFVPAGKGCRLELSHKGFGEGPEWERAVDWQSRAWSSALDRLQSLLS